jgi:hypothetical protein
MALLSDDVTADSWYAGARIWFAPGSTTHGHHQIELACGACHTPFGGKEALQQACVKCHGAELKEARDSHPRSKFTDPRNADRAAKLEAALCVTCHVEHRPEITHVMGVTRPTDFCVICHEDIAEERPTHAGLGFDTCASSGCHNFHDNRALYDDFLVKHAHDPALLAQRTLPARNFLAVLEDVPDYPHDRNPVKALAAAEADAPAPWHGRADIANDWLASAHARAGVNCSGCHAKSETGGQVAWNERPTEAVCATCHKAEAKGFLAGKHGMRLPQKLPPMTPKQARAPMKAEAHDTALGCIACHSAHRFDTRRAAVEGCMTCHDDTHTRAYLGSPHHRAWVKELKGETPVGSGVSCATCHLPRIEARIDDVPRILVQHNQNDNLRPNEKMLRSACMHCHGLGFGIDALADRKLIDANFKGRPSLHIRGIEMAIEAEARAQASREMAKP